MPKPASPSHPSSGKRTPSSQPGNVPTGKRSPSPRRNWGRRLTGFWAVVAATATASSLGLVAALERQTQTMFLGLRGRVAPPADVVILAIDESSLTQGEFFQADPQRYRSLESIEVWPWQRKAYALAIDQLMAAGARAVAIDILFSTRSIYGEADDRQFADTLQRHRQRVVLASRYVETATPQGTITQLTSPLSEFCADARCTGFINLLLEPDGRVHRLGPAFLNQLRQNLLPEEAVALPQLPAFADATLQAAQVPPVETGGETIFFHGPAHTIEAIPFWFVLDPTTWETTLQSGQFFKDKIVLIGSTAPVHQDFHPTPMSETWLHPEPMAGVEIHANAIATLLTGRSLTTLLPSAPARGLFVLVLIGGSGWLLSRTRQSLHQLAWAMGLMGFWIGISYSLFVYGRVIVPTAIPAIALGLCGISQLVMGSIDDQLKKRQLRDTLKQYVTSPIVQEIISQQDDLQDLLHERELAMAGKLLGGRYRITRVLGSGGFSETYVAEDGQRPGSPLCVVKRLRVISDNPSTLKLARRLFATEAELLERLGRHEHIPQLLASFEENHEFYLVQEFIDGHSLLMEVLPKRSLPVPQVVQMLNDLLAILDFVHHQGIIHRDLKPSNVMRRQADRKLVLIDFGVAKKLTTQLAEQVGAQQFTVAVGTPGYMPGEQSAGRPHFNSDIYALGMMAIEALTGKAPHALNLNAMTGAVQWLEHSHGVDPHLAMVLDKMVHHDFTQRYQTVQDVQADLAPLVMLMAAPAMTVLPASNRTASEMTAPLDGVTAELEALDPVTAEFMQDETVNLPEDWIHP